MSLDVLRTSGRLEFPSSRREFAATPYGGKKEISRKVRRILEQMGEIPFLHRFGRSPKRCSICFRKGGFGNRQVTNKR